MTRATLVLAGLRWLPASWRLRSSTSRAKSRRLRLLYLLRRPHNSIVLMRRRYNDLFITKFVRKYTQKTNKKSRTYKTRRLYCVKWHNTVFARSGPLSVHKLFTSCIRRCLMSRACELQLSDLALSAALVIFSFQFSLLFFNTPVASPGSTSTAACYWFTYAISEIDENLRRYLSRAEPIDQGKTLKRSITLGA